MKHRRSTFSDKRSNRSGSDVGAKEMGRVFSISSERKKDKPDPRQSIKMLRENDLYERLYS